MINRDFQTGLLRYYSSGIDYAKKELDAFISKKINHYHDLRNHPDEDYQSNLSPYLNFGQISPLYIASEIYKIENDNSEKFLDELIIRRELSYNFVHYNMNYDNINCLQDWAHRSLQENTVFEREYIYNLEELENAKTHDVYWNAAQNEMVLTGKMHGYMRMYWGKKILEWSRYPDEAFELALFLNNKYSLDGYNPNSYAGIAWCFGKHDRPWSERKIFGKVRYMNAAGLCRKFNMPAYLQKVTALTNL